MCKNSNSIFFVKIAIKAYFSINLKLKTAIIYFAIKLQSNYLQQSLMSNLINI